MLHISPRSGGGGENETLALPLSLNCELIAEREARPIYPQTSVEVRAEKLRY